jgi:hypothetical protein
MIINWGGGPHITLYIYFLYLYIWQYIIRIDSHFLTMEVQSTKFLPPSE